MHEIWVNSKKHPQFLVSNLGNVVYKDTGLEPKFFMNKGRKQITVQVGWRSEIVQLHRMIAAAFFADDIEGYEVNHIDGNRTNNAIWNLELSTHEQNREHAYQHGLMHRPLRLRNVDTGEEYESASQAGLKLGRISAVSVPKNVRESGAVFTSKGVRLQVIA